MKPLEILDSITEVDFIENYVRQNRPVVVRDVEFDIKRWTPEFLNEIMGDLKVQVYDTLFSLQEISTLSEYLKDNFGAVEPREKVPYIRWYNTLKNIDYAWGNEAFQRISTFWKKPSFLPKKDLLVPVTNAERSVDPVTDLFPYRGILIAAKGARTRLHRDPFCSDAIVSQFYGVKEFVMYHPDRTSELLKKSDGNSFGGFIDVREAGMDKAFPEPDYHGLVGPGHVVYVPHGWLHDVLVLEDSLSVTWNFVHEKGALEFIDYLMDSPEKDSEFEVLRYFYSLAGENFTTGNEIVKKYNKKFSEIEADLAY